VNNADGSTNFAPTNPTPTLTPFGFEAGAAPVVSVASGIVLPPIDPAALTGSVCALMFPDRNTNRIQDSDETGAVADGVIQLLTPDASAVVGQALTLVTGEPQCFNELSPGDYLLVAGAPGNFGLTTPEQLRLRVAAGERLLLGFGAAEGFVPSSPPPADAGVPETAAAPETAPVGVLQTDNVGVLVFGAGVAVAMGGLALSLLLARR